MKKKRIYHKVIRIEGKTKNNRWTFIEFGWVENPTFKNDIYYTINSAHKGGSGSWELRTDEALLYIQGLSAVIRRKLTGTNLVLKEKKEILRRSEKWENHLKNQLQKKSKKCLTSINKESLIEI